MRSSGWGTDRWRGVLLAAVLGLGCASSAANPATTPLSASAPSSHAEPPAELLQVVGEALTEPETDRAFDAAFDRIGEDPQVATAGEKLLDRLGGDPEVTRAAEQLYVALASDEKFVAYVLKIRDEHPDDFEAAIDRQMNALFSSPRAEGAFEHGAAVLMKRPEVVAALGDVVQALMGRGEIEAALARSMTLAFERSSKRRRVATVGVPAWDKDYEAAVSAYLNDPARLERTLVRFAQIFGAHPAPRRAMAAILSSEAFHARSVPLVRKVVADRQVMDRAGAMVLAVVLDDGSTDLTRYADEAMTAPPLVAAAAEWLRALATEREVVSQFATAFIAVGESAEFVDAIDEVYFGERSVARLDD